MNTFKKIYILIILLTILSLSYLCLISLDIININLADKTSLYIFVSAITISTMSLLLSRSANVIANRKNLITGYTSACIGLLNIILVIIFLITNNEIISNIIQIMLYITIIFSLITLIFEVPQANSTHGKIQKLIATIIIITAIFPYASGLKKIDKFTFDDFFKIEEKTNENTKTLIKIETVLIFLSISGFIINPMLRMYYIDRDYFTENQLKDDFNLSNKYQANTTPNPNKILSEKYRKNNNDNHQFNPQIQNNNNFNNNVNDNKFVQPPTDSPFFIEELPKEKVINQQFHPEEFKEVIIPGITETNNQIETLNPEEKTETFNIN